MTRYRAVPLLLALAACSSIDGLWVFQVDEGTVDEAPAGCEENFLDAICAVTPEVGEDGPWTVTDDLTTTPGLVTAELLDGDHGHAWLVWRSVIIPLEKSGSSLTGTWTGSTDGTHEEQHEDGYDWTYTQTGTTTIDVDLKKGDGGSYVGTIHQKLSATSTYAETDEWDAQTVGVFSGQIAGAFSNGALESTEDGDDSGFDSGFSGDGVQNYPDEDDCKGNTCTGKLTVSAEATRPVTAWPTTGDRDPGAGTYDSAETPPGGGWSLDL